MERGDLLQRDQPGKHGQGNRIGERHHLEGGQLPVLDAAQTLLDQLAQPGTHLQVALEPPPFVLQNDAVQAAPDRDQLAEIQRVATADPPQGVGQVGTELRALASDLVGLVRPGTEEPPSQLQGVVLPERLDIDPLDDPLLPQGSYRFHLGVTRLHDHHRLGALGGHQLEQQGGGLAVDAVGVVDADEQLPAAGLVHDRLSDGLEQRERAGLLTGLATDVGHQRSEGPEWDGRPRGGRHHPQDLVIAALAVLSQQGPGQPGLADPGVSHEQDAPTACPEGRPGRPQLCLSTHQTYLMGRPLTHVFHYRVPDRRPVGVIGSPVI